MDRLNPVNLLFDSKRFVLSSLERFQYTDFTKIGSVAPSRLTDATIARTPIMNTILRAPSISGPVTLGPEPSFIIEPHRGAV